MPSSMNRMYHISKKGNPEICRAKTPETCKAKPLDGMQQVHGYDKNSIVQSIEEKIKSREGNFPEIKKKDLRPKTLFKKGVKVPQELLGSAGSDVDRLIVAESRKYMAGKPEDPEAFHVFLKDVEGRPMAFIKVVKNFKTQELELNDIEVREEYRGNKLSHRLIKACEKSFGLPMTHRDGGYTASGLTSVASLFHSPEEIDNWNEYSIYNEMTFIHDWDEMQAKYPF